MSQRERVGRADRAKGGLATAWAERPWAEENSLAAPTSLLPSIREGIGSPGQPLDPATRALLEPRLGHDFGQVRVHTDAPAAESARAVGARAFTFGRDLVFGAGQYAPSTASGRALLAHELTHVAQQAGAPAPTGELAISSRADPTEQEARQTAPAVVLGRQARPRVGAALHLARDDETETEAPPELAENPYTGPIMAEEFRRLTISVVKDRILEPLRRHDAISFLNRLRATEAEDLRLLEADASFLAELRRHLRGSALWTVRLILRFQNRPRDPSDPSKGVHDTRPVFVRELHLAVFLRNFQRIKDLLRTFPELGDETQVPGVREMLDQQFAGQPVRAELLRLVDERVMAASGVTATYRQAHYEQPEGGGPYQLERQTGRTNYDLRRTASELRVVVRIRFVHDARPTETYYPEDAVANRWRRGIEAAWNNLYAADNGATRLRIIFVPTFTDQDPHFEVKVVEGAEVRSAERRWWVGISGETAAHEFGHMVGNPDEYRLPGRISDIPASMGLSAEEARRSSVEGITGTPETVGPSGKTLPGIMGEETGTAQRRHVWPILEFFNANVKGADEAEFRLMSQ